MSYINNEKMMIKIRLQAGVKNEITLATEESNKISQQLLIPIDYLFSHSNSFIRDEGVAICQRLNMELSRVNESLYKAQSLIEQLQIVEGDCRDEW